ncbi:MULTISPECIES: hypothetical protein [Morganellaceae]|uniref:hypothetical protein n=1 Tax=Morganellaceae TaxID=1903414 RepID=UPI001B361AF7|nr:hypothetical protein [Proteus mirabilis]MBQ0519609.1 hypothetical protein [Proteus mirabilis]
MKANKLILFAVLSLSITHIQNAISAESQMSFSLSEICKAGLSTIYDRDIDIMQSTEISNNISRIRYIRSQDGKLFSYLCRKESTNRLSFFDENLPNARWYGADLSEPQIFFSTANNVLTIRDVVNGETLKTYIFSRNDFIDKKETSKDEMDKINIWLDEYITNSFNKTNAWDVKYIGVTQTMSSPVNTYMLNFDTTDKKLLSLKNADVDAFAFEQNISRISKWKNSFCTKEISDFMIKYSIDVLHSKTSNNGELQFISTCYKGSY